MIVYRTQRIRSCFLYCILFPKDYKISRSSSIDFWLGKGLLDGSDGSAGRYQGHSKEGDDCIKMSDAVHGLMGGM